jgi:putative ABC transport system permease protein
MRLFDLILLSAENLGRRKGRALLTAIGVVIGTAAVVVLVSLGLGLQRSMSVQVGNISELTQIQVSPNYGDYGGGFMVEVAVPGGGPTGPPPNQKLITDQSLKDLANLPGITGVYPRDYLQGGQIQLGKLEGWGSFLGVTPETMEGLGLEAQQGVLDLERGTIVVGALVNQNFYNPRWRPGDPPPTPPDLFNQTIKVILSRWSKEGVETRKTIQARVVGVLTETRSEPDYSIYMSLEEVESYNQWIMGRKINREKDGYPMAIIKVGELSQVLDLADQISEQGYYVYTLQTYVQGTNSFFLVLQIVFGGIGAISLLVAAIGIANTMTMAILERTREIGLMKAVGATNRDVMGIFLGEAAGIGFLGGVGGVFLGWSVGQVVNVLGMAYIAGQAEQMGGMSPIIASYTPTWLPIFALIFATLIGVFSGLYPALRAATLVPVVALRYE